MHVPAVNYINDKQHIYYDPETNKFIWLSLLYDNFIQFYLNFAVIFDILRILFFY